jgi:hypothetical protein
MTDICPGCGMDRDRLGPLKGFNHYESEIVPHRLCREGRPLSDFLTKEQIEAIDRLAAEMGMQLAKTMEKLIAGTV